MSQFQRQFKRASVTKMLCAEVSRTLFALPKGEEQYEPQTYLSPTGRVVAKVIVAGTAVEREDIGKDTSLWRLRIVDPTGSISIFAGQYQPEAAQAIAELEVPAFVAVVGKLNLFEPESGSIIVSLRPASVTRIDGASRDDLVLDAALSTARSVKKASADADLMKRVTEAYGENRDDHAAFLLMAQQALESLLPAPLPPAEQPASPAADNLSKPPAPAEDEKKVTKKPAAPEPKKAPPHSSPAYPYPKTEKKGDGTLGKFTQDDSGKGKPDATTSTAEVILKLLNRHHTVEFAKIPNMLKELGLDPTRLDIAGAVSLLKGQGLCYEPKLGVLKVVT